MGVAARSAMVVTGPIWVGHSLARGGCEALTFVVSLGLRLWCPRPWQMAGPSDLMSGVHSLVLSLVEPTWLP